MTTLKELAATKGYSLRHYTQLLTKNESLERIKRPFDFSNDNGGTLDGFKYYNSHYLYPIK